MGEEGPEKQGSGSVPEEEGEMESGEEVEMSDGDDDGEELGYTFGSDDFAYDEGKQESESDHEEEAAAEYRGDCKGFKALNKSAARAAEEELLAAQLAEATAESKGEHYVDNSGGSKLAGGGDLWSLPLAQRQAQQELGPQSCRGCKWDTSGVHDDWGKKCFEQMKEAEREMCNDWVVYYHSYAWSTLLYETQAALAKELFGYEAPTTLPRIRADGFSKYQDASSLRQDFGKYLSSGRDEDDRYRCAAICVTTSLMDTDSASEAPPLYVWYAGYSGGNEPKNTPLMTELLKACGLAEDQIQSVTKKLEDVATTYQMGPGNGQLLQIFIRRSVNSAFAYPALAYGHPDKTREPFDAYLAGRGPIKGQARIVANPPMLVNTDLVRLRLYSSRESYHKSRASIQKAIIRALDPILGSDIGKAIARTGLHPPPPRSLQATTAPGSHPATGPAPTASAPPCGQNDQSNGKKSKPKRGLMGLFGKQ